MERESEFEIGYLKFEKDLPHAKAQRRQGKKQIKDIK
jgi:hypothetical protein